MSTILIIGGAGFIGTHLTSVLASMPQNTIDVVDNFSRTKEQGTEFLRWSNVNYIQMDVANDFQSNLLQAKYDKVYFLASVVGVDFVLNHPTYVLTENMKIISNISNWMIGINCGRLLYTSTSEVYAGAVEKGFAPVPTNEDVPIVIEDISHPRFTYATTKAYGEALFLNAVREFDFEAVVLRYHNVYGNNMGNRHVLPHLFTRFQVESPFTIYGGEQTRSFNHVSDAVAGTILVMDKGKSGEVYHVGTDVEVTIEDFTRFVGSELGYNGEYIKGAAYPGSVKRRSPDIKKLRSLGYMPKIDWKSGVRQYLEDRKGG
jgi:UDP-glucose 4-epimerase